METWLSTLPDSSYSAISMASVDASFRRYFRVNYSDRSCIVMDAPPGKEDTRPFVEIAKKLCFIGVHSPEVFAINEQQGFLLLEDLGNKDYLDFLDTDSAQSLYTDAIGAIVTLQKADCAGLPNYSSTVLMDEMGLFTHWLLEKQLSIKLTEADKQQLERVYAQLVSSATEQPQAFTHRDFHSRNLMITEANNPGIIDFQDAVCGPFTYDLVSLLRDCYIDWPQQQINDWIHEFISVYHTHNHVIDIDDIQFEKWFDLMGIQRHLKASGIFCRLKHRDNKEGYMKDIPRTLNYIVDVGSKYPQITPLLDLIERYNVVKELSL